MLISFKISNSRSIGEDLEFSAIATNDTILPENTIELPKYGIRVLKTMALFGANASGKTNILKAFADARNIICKPEFDKKEIFFPFNRNHSENNDKPILYSFTFLIDEMVYNYAFKHNQERILEESLTENIDAEKEQMIYSRKFNKETKKYEWLPKEYFENKNINFFQLSTAEHKLFLTIANNPVNEDAVEKNLLLEKIYNWLKNQLKPIINLSNEGKLSRVLRTSESGIAQEENNFDYFITFLQKSDKNKKQIIKFLKKVHILIEDIQIIELAELKITNSVRPYLYVNLDKNENKASYVIIKTYHKAFNEKNEVYSESFDLFKEESSGTKILLAWLGFWLYSFQKENKSSIFVVDELGTSLHPKLMLYIMRFFANKETNPYNSQLIFTTHEVKLMDKTVMRPDQLYLINKDKQGNTSVERTSDYAEIEKYVRLDTLYMYGGMSGMPMIHN